MMIDGLLFFNQFTNTELPGLDRLRQQALGRRLLCRVCGNPITSPAERIEMSGSHQHRFTNPAGQSFTIGCFRSAAGCRPDGEAWRQFSWFPDHAWRVALCNRCETHLGWRFQGDSVFYGLIIKHLRNAG